MGTVRLRKDARLSLGHFLADPVADKKDWVRRFHGATRVAGDPRRVPQRSAKADCHAGVPSRPASSSSESSVTRARVSTICESISGKRRKKGHLWAMVYRCSHFGRDGRERPKDSFSGTAATPIAHECWAHSTSRCHNWLSFSCLHILRTEMASSSFLHWQRVPLTPPVANHAVHVDRRGAPHVCGRRRASVECSSTGQLMKDAGFSGMFERSAG